MWSVSLNFLIINFEDVLENIQKRWVLKKKDLSPEIVIKDCIFDFKLKMFINAVPKYYDANKSKKSNTNFLNKVIYHVIDLKKRYI